MELLCTDSVLNLTAVLSYSVFEDTDVIARHVSILNNSENTIWLTKVSSMCMDMDNREFEAITLHGSWARERHIQRQKIGIGMQGVASGRGNPATRIIHLLHWSPPIPHRIPVKYTAYSWFIRGIMNSGRMSTSMIL